MQSQRISIAMSHRFPSHSHRQMQSTWREVRRILGPTGINRAWGIVQCRWTWWIFGWRWLRWLRWRSHDFCDATSRDRDWKVNGAVLRLGCHVPSRWKQTFLNTGHSAGNQTCRWKSTRKNRWFPYIICVSPAAKLQHDEWIRHVFLGDRSSRSMCWPAVRSYHHQKWWAMTSTKDVVASPRGRGQMTDGPKILWLFGWETMMMYTLTAVFLVADPKFSDPLYVRFITSVSGLHFQL